MRFDETNETKIEFVFDRGNYLDRIIDPLSDFQTMVGIRSLMSLPALCTCDNKRNRGESTTMKRVWVQNILIIIIALLVILCAVEISRAGSFTISSTGIDDAYLNGAALQHDNGTCEDIYVGDNYARRNGIIKAPAFVDSLGANTFDSGYFYYYMGGASMGATDTIIITRYRLLRSWTEGNSCGSTGITGEVTGDSAVVGTVKWTTACAEGSGTDYYATAENDGVHRTADTFVGSGVVGYVKFWVSAATANVWKTANYGLLLRYTYLKTVGKTTYWSTAEALSNKPSFVCYYSTPSSGNISSRRRRMGTAE